LGRIGELSEERGMGKQDLGILHPGAMGISIAASAQNSGQTVYWASEGRSPQTHTRADKHNLLDAGSLRSLCDTCPIVICVCPPHAAEEVAKQVLEQGFDGLYVDANAISPQRAVRIGRMMVEEGVSFVDGGIVGGPAWKPDRTWLYLSGGEAERVASLFSAGPLETEVIGDSPGKASALKMCYAAYTKGTSALLSAILAAAEVLDVREELSEQWSRHGSDFAKETHARVQRITAKAWRFAGEMEEIADTFEQAGVPRGFHMASADIYRRIAHFKDATELPPMEDVLAALSDGSGSAEA
jgi:3-hydroxyisobutyrate dehydrogenase-like beta-hydroxyacid dehydrogenase